LKPKREKREISGVLLLDKPVGVTSNGALQHAKRLFRAAKAGHTGILDPLASGLLPICFGEATKFSQFLTDADKAYDATARLGEVTNTGDAEGEVIERHPVQVTRGQVEAALPRFLGAIEQTPPMYSALKHQGRPLYDYARQGIDIPRPPRPVTIHALTLQRFEGDAISFSVDCSKGTYIRVLAEDIGRLLGCGAHLTALRRTRTGGFRLDQAITLDALEAMDGGTRDACLLPLDCLVADLQPIQLDADSSYYLRQGQQIWLPKLDVALIYRVYDENQQFIGVCEVDEQGRLKPKRLLATGAEK
jgi:tRNA pseudouridine55 synthase